MFTTVTRETAKVGQHVLFASATDGVFMVKIEELPKNRHAKWVVRRGRYPELLNVAGQNLHFFDEEDKELIEQITKAHSRAWDKVDIESAKYDTAKRALDKVNESLKAAEDEFEKVQDEAYEKVKKLKKN